MEEKERVKIPPSIEHWVRDLVLGLLSVISFMVWRGVDNLEASSRENATAIKEISVAIAVESAATTNIQKALETTIIETNTLREAIAAMRERVAVLERVAILESREADKRHLIRPQREERK